MEGPEVDESACLELMEPVDNQKDPDPTSHAFPRHRQAP